MILRIPHSPRRVKSIWSLALCWNPKSGRTCALFDGVADADINILRNYLNSHPRLQSHALTLPTMLMDILSQYRILSRNVLERILFDLEIKLGVTRGRAAVLSLEERSLSNELDEITMKCNQLMTSITYQERGQVFIKDLAESLRQELSAQYETGNRDLQLKLRNSSLALEDIVANCSNLAVNTIHQTLCLGKRAQMLLDVVCSISHCLISLLNSLDLHPDCPEGQPRLNSNSCCCQKGQFCCHRNCCPDNDILAGNLHYSNTFPDIQ